ncbi:MAG: VWA domain-containing protein [Chthonomonadales bacterium]|nr:VWA domain-containing protein [Chthonomonadales bacterium]
MGGVSFLNPAFLGALALGALPILVHLVRRRRVRVVPWAAWEFLRAARRRKRRRLRVEQLVLLAVRVLVVLLVALAFARPVLRAPRLAMAGGAGRVHAVIALDNSYSMGAVRDGRTAWERAVRAARDVVAQALRPGDSASLLLLSSPPEAPLSEPTLDLGRVRRLIARARLSDRATDYDAAAALCLRLLSTTPGRANEVYWVTDGQRAGFRSGDRARARRAWAELGRRARVSWIDVGAPRRQNLAVEAPSLGRELAAARSPVRVAATVRNYGDEPVRDLLVSLRVDGRAAGAARVDVPARGHADASFVHVFAGQGFHAGEIAVDRPDALDRDNRAWFTLRSRERLRVLVVNPAPSADPARDEAFYALTALSPTGAAEGGLAPVRPTLHRGLGLAALDLGPYDAVVFTGLAPVVPADRRALALYVRRGGGLLLVPGATTHAAQVNAALATAPDGAFLPARLGPRAAVTAALNPSSIDHPALAAFRDTSDANLGSARIALRYPLSVAPNDDAVRVALRFDDGQPALVERRYGQGRVMLYSGTFGPAGGSLPFRAAFVPLVHQLAAYLGSGAGAGHNLTVGDPLSARFDVRAAGRAVRVTAPDGAVTSEPSRLAADGVLFTHPETAMAGHYRAAVTGGPLEQAELYAVNLPAGESDLAPASEREVRVATGLGSILFGRSDGSIRDLVRRGRTGAEAWGPLLGAAIAMLFLEALLAWRFGRRG